MIHTKETFSPPGGLMKASRSKYIIIRLKQLLTEKEKEKTHTHKELQEVVITLSKAN